MPARVVCKKVESHEEWSQALAIRLAVFVQEQGVPSEEEVDEHDASALHLLALADGKAVGTGRLVMKDGTGWIGRMAVLPQARRRGVGSRILQQLMAEAKQAGATELVLNSQLHACTFYARYGFVSKGEIFLDAGIAHRRMEKAVVTRG